MHGTFPFVVVVVEIASALIDNGRWNLFHKNIWNRRIIAGRSMKRFLINVVYSGEDDTFL